MHRAVKLVGLRGVVKGPADRGLNFFSRLGRPGGFQPFGEFRRPCRKVFGQIIQHLRAVVAGGFAPAFGAMGGLDRVADVLAVAQTSQAQCAALGHHRVGIARIRAALPATDEQFCGAVDGPALGGGIGHRRGVRGDGCGFGLCPHRHISQIGQHAFAPALTAKAAFTVTAKAGGGVEDVGGVHPHHTGFDLGRYVQRQIDVFRPDRGGKAVAGVVGQFHRLVRRTECGERGHRAKDLDLGENVGGGDIGEETRREEAAYDWKVALRLMQDGALGLPLRHQTLDAGQLHRIDDGAHVGGFVQRIADPQFRQPRLQTVGEDRGEAFLHKDAGAGAAHLPLIEPDRIDDALDRAINVGIGENDEGRLAAQFQCQLLGRPGGHLADLAANFG